jgi:hypothetical protein
LRGWRRPPGHRSRRKVQFCVVRTRRGMPARRRLRLPSIASAVGQAQIRKRLLAPPRQQYRARQSPLPASRRIGDLRALIVTSGRATELPAAIFPDCGEKVTEEAGFQRRPASSGVKFGMGAFGSPRDPRAVYLTRLSRRNRRTASSCPLTSRLAPHAVARRFLPRPAGPRDRFTPKLMAPCWA